MSGPYGDMLHLPHHVSKTRPQMPVANRAAQFSPFAALTGYDDAIKETARVTDTQIELSESTIADLDIKLGLLADAAAEQPEITVTYFQPDDKKDGGSYITVTGALKKIDDYARMMVLTDGKKIEIPQMTNIECGLFDALM